MAHSMPAWAMPRACPAIPIRPASSVCIAILKPWPSAPRSWSLGMTTSSKMTELVGEARIPSFLSRAPKLTPSCCMSTMKAEIKRVDQREKRKSKNIVIAFKVIF